MDRSSLDGLTRAEVQDRIRLGLANSMPARTTRTFKEIFRANVFTTFNAILSSLLDVGIFGLPFPFLPRHLSLNSELTIGIPAFFMALAPNLTRYKPGFVARVLRFALPVGAIIAASALTTFIMAQNSPLATLEESMTVTTFVLISISMWVVIILTAVFLIEAIWRLVIQKNKLN